ncbi:MAG: tetratricopeptide repeat protein, partial [Candidatus Methanofastidiosia archaeon]
DPENIDGWLRLGQAAGNSGDHTKAQECFQKAVDLDPENIGGWGGLGQIYVDQLFQYTDAINCLKKILQLEPENETAKSNLVEAYFCSENFKESLKLAQELFIEENKPIQKLNKQFFIICNLFFMNKIKEAQTQLKKFESLKDNLSPDTKNTWSYEGVKQFIESKKINKDHKEIIFTLIETLEKFK